MFTSMLVAGPLLCRPAVAETRNGCPAVAETGEVTVTEVALVSVPGIGVGVGAGVGDGVGSGVGSGVDEGVGSGAGGGVGVGTGVGSGVAANGGVGGEVMGPPAQYRSLCFSGPCAELGSA
jgi:hypothetical protein